MILALDTDKWVQSSGLTLFARLLMIFASLVALPIAGWMLQRVVTTADEISAKVGVQGTKIELLDQTVKYGFDAAKGDITGIRMQLTDHEGRIRVIESRPH